MESVEAHPKNCQPFNFRGTGGLAADELIGFCDQTSDHPWLANYENGLARYRNGDFPNAITSFRAVLSMRPHDGPATLMVDRCRSRAFV